MSLDLDELGSSARTDFRRANGAPMVQIDGKSERYSRPSSYAKPLDDESALVNWKIDRGCIGVAHDRALQARWAAISDDNREAKSKLREDSIAAGRGAERADIGTALHAMSVRSEKGEVGFAPPEPYSTSLDAYVKELRRLGLVTVRYEFPIVNVEHRCAGTADRLYELTFPLIAPTGELLPTGTLVVGDLKTGDKLEYSKAAYAVQLAIYAGGQFYDVVEDCTLATPPINQEWAIIVHMPADDPGVCEFLWVDLDVGRFGAYLVDQIKLWRKNWRSGEFSLPAVMVQSDLVEAFDTGPATVVDAPVVDEVVSHAPTNEVDDGGASLESWVDWIRERLVQIAQHSGAKQALMLAWPEGLPTPKQGIDSMYQVGLIIKLLDKIEADYQLGFVARPAGIRSTGPSTRKRKGH